jgi:hypothetical protein
MNFCRILPSVDQLNELRRLRGRPPITRPTSVLGKAFRYSCLAVATWIVACVLAAPFLGIHMQDLAVIYAAFAYYALYTVLGWRLELAWRRRLARRRTQSAYPARLPRSRFPSPAAGFFEPGVN